MSKEPTQGFFTSTFKILKDKRVIEDDEDDDEQRSAGKNPVVGKRLWQQ